MRAPVGGLFRHVADLTEALAARGHAIGIVADSEGGDARTADMFARLAPHASLGIHRLPIPRGLGAGDITTPLAIRQLARRLGIDVLHGHGAKGGFAARLVRMAGGAPVVLYTPHGGVLHYPPNSMSGRVFRFLERTLLAQTDALIFESAFAQAAFTAGIATPNCPAEVIHNGLAPAEFVPVLPREDAHDFVFVGEFRTLKGIFVLLDALVDVKAPDGRPASLVMAGGGPEFEAAKSRIAELGLTDRVQLAGVQPAREMFARGHCAVVPSLAESLPYVVLEAAAAGRPVIATRVGGIAEIFGPTSASLLPAGDFSVLRHAMQSYMNDPAAAAKEAEVRLEFIGTRFSIARMTDQIEALYHRLQAARTAR
ncbi:MAG TPA: glycosyltransferase [Devosiaceae bacterium]|nr:glycosyltransferase [Devosiaceae bacterium]